METHSHTAGATPRRAAHSARIAALMATILAFAAAFDLVDPEIAVEACAILFALAFAFFALIRSGLSRGFSDPGLLTEQVAAIFLFLAYLAWRVEHLGAIVMLLYPAAMAGALFHLSRARLIALAALAVAALAIALLAIAARAPALAPAAIWMHLLALTGVLALLVSASGYVARLRAGIGEVVRSQHEKSIAAVDGASRDPLTGVHSRRHMLDALEREIARVGRTVKPLSVVRIDIDRFRDINQTFGYAAGDAALVRFAAAAQAIARDADTLGRVGGKEFLLLMPDTDLAGAAIGAERLRAEIARTAPDPGAEPRLSCSIGIAQYAADETPAAVLARAEAGLNYAKAAGRNRVVAADGSDLTSAAA